MSILGSFAIELLGELLCDGTATTSGFVAHDTALDDSTRKSPEVDAGMLVEAHVLSGDKRLDQIIGQRVVAYQHTVLRSIAPRTEQFSIVAINT